MYSDELLRAFKKNDIALGDTISVAKDGKETIGELMPGTEAGSSNAVVLKLSSGYNIGVSVTPKTTIKKIKGGTGKITFPQSHASGKKGLPKVTLIYTGGTIGSKIDYKTGGVYMLTKPEELLHEVPEISDIASLVVKNPFSIASEDMSYMEWQEIAKEIVAAFKDGSHGVVITMGTDTMHYTAAALSFMLHDLNGPVIVTGAQRSSDRGSSDAFLNLACSVKLAAESDVAEVGICMHSTSSDDECMLIRGTRARKMHTSRRDAFRPINDRPIAYVGRDLKIKYANDYNKSVSSVKEPPTAETSFEGKVALVKSYPNSDPGIIDYYAGKGYRGIVIEGTGLGHFPASTKHEELLWLNHVSDAVKKGIIVCMASQCLYGRVNDNVYRNLRLISGAGVIYCDDMLPETAYVKLGWLLGNFGTKESEQLMAKDLRRETKPRSGYDEFLV